MLEKKLNGYVIGFNDGKLGTSIYRKTSESNEPYKYPAIPLDHLNMNNLNEIEICDTFKSAQRLRDYLGADYILKIEKSFKIFEE